MKITKLQLKQLVKEELESVLRERAGGAISVPAWLLDTAKEEIRDKGVERLQKVARKLLKNPNIAGGQWAASLTKVAGGALTVYAVWQAYQDMSEIMKDPNVAAEWNDDIARALSAAGHGLAKHGAPSDPRSWGVKSCDELHGYALKSSCARWEAKHAQATSPKAAERHGGRQWEGRKFPPLYPGGGWRTWDELSQREKKIPAYIKVRQGKGKIES